MLEILFQQKGQILNLHLLPAYHAYYDSIPESLALGPPQMLSSPRAMTSTTPSPFPSAPPRSTSPGPRTSESSGPGPSMRVEDTLRVPDHEHVWDFHNMRVMVASDLAIFGDKNHPAVSLRVRDSEWVRTTVTSWTCILHCPHNFAFLCDKMIKPIIKKFSLLYNYMYIANPSISWLEWTIGWTTWCAMCLKLSCGMQLFNTLFVF